MQVTEAVVAVSVVTMLFGIPLLGLTLRFSLKPLVEAYIRLREAQLGSLQVQKLQQRVDLLEKELELRGMLERPASAPVQQLTHEQLLPLNRERS